MKTSFTVLVLILVSLGKAECVIAQEATHKTSTSHDHHAAAKEPVKDQHATKKDGGSHDAHWGYDGEHNADHWGDMKTEFATCKIGGEQSPIDIVTQTIESADLPPLQTAYTDSILAIINNGHTVQINYKANGMMAVGSDNYQLLQFHFHTPSEEKINGKPADMVAHFVHKNDRGELAVIALLLNRGKENEALADIMKHLPTEARGELLYGDIKVPFGKLFPADRGYYTFKGSLTTPPCTEGVRWFVLKTPVTLSEAQWKAFNQIYSMNARPVQPLNKRKIQQTK